MDPVRLFSDTFNVDYSAAAYLVGALSSIPVAYLHRFIRSSALRHLYAAVSGVLLTLISFTPDVLLHFFLAATFTIVAMRTQRRICGLVTFIGTFAHLIACHVIFTSDEARRTGRVDFTGTLTMVAIKLTSLAMDYQDGLKALKADAKRAKDGEKPGDDEGTEGKKSAVDAAAGMAEKPRARAIKAMPSLLEIFGYLFCCGQHLLGPYFDYPTYCDWTNRRGVWSPSTRSPSPIPPFLRVAFQGAIAAAVFLLIAPRLDLSQATDPAIYFALPFLRRVLLVFHATLVTRWRCYIVWSIAEAAMVSGGLGFSGWVAAPAPPAAAAATASSPAAPAPAAIIATKEIDAVGNEAVGADEHEGKENGVGAAAPAANGSERALMGEVGNKQGGRAALAETNGVAGSGKQKSRVYTPSVTAPAAAVVPAADSMPAWSPIVERQVASWDRARNVNIIGMELAGTGADVAKNWNISFSTWLRIYVYERLAASGKKFALFNLLFTFFISAISHGLNPGDLIGFAHWALMIAGSRVIYRWCKPLAKGSLAQRAASALHFLYVLFCINYSGFGFSVMTYEHTMQAYRGLYYYGTIIPMAVILAGNFVRAPRARGGKKSIKTE